MSSSAADYTQDFSSGSIPFGWANCGTSTWDYVNDASQTEVSSGGIENVLYTGVDYSQTRTVQAKITPDTVETNDGNDRFGISVLGSTAGNGAGSGQSVNLVWNSQVGSGRLVFLYDGIAWGTGVTFNVSAGSSYYFKAQYASGVFSGKAWLTTDSEPGSWQVTMNRTPDATELYSGLCGDVLSQGSKASYDDFSITTGAGGPLLDEFSTDHTGFSAGASHPTASGVEQTYTVQTALANDTYYWRVRAIDPSGSNTYGAWSPGSGSLGYQSFTIVSGGTSALVTAYSFQRKTFYDSGDGIYWRFYYDGTQVKIDYNSQPWTSSWTAETAVSENTNDFSLWDDDTSVYMAYLDTNDIRVKKGTLNASSISWDSNTSGVCTSGECVALDGTSASDTYQYAYVTKDSSGYIWVVAQFYNGTNYYMKARRTSAANDLTAWGTATNLSLTSNTDTNVYGSISSLGSQHMYAVWIRGTAIEGQKYTEGSDWAGSATGIATGKSGVSANFSMSSDTSYNLHLAYIDSGDDVYYKKYTTGSNAWDVSATTIDNVGISSYTTVSVNTSNNDIYVLYLRSSIAYYNKYTGSWGGATDTNWTEGTSPAHLTSNYADDGRIFAEWTSGSGSPYSLNWNYIIIPEKIWLFMGLGLVIPELLRRRRKAVLEKRLVH